MILSRWFALLGAIFFLLFPNSFSAEVRRRCEGPRCRRFAPLTATELELDTREKIARKKCITTRTICRCVCECGPVGRRSPRDISRGNFKPDSGKQFILFVGSHLSPTPTPPRRAAPPSNSPDRCRVTLHGIFGVAALVLAWRSSSKPFGVFGICPKVMVTTDLRFAPTDSRFPTPRKQGDSFPPSNIHTRGLDDIETMLKREQMPLNV